MKIVERKPVKKHKSEYLYGEGNLASVYGVDNSSIYNKQDKINNQNKNIDIIFVHILDYCYTCIVV